MTGEAVKKGGSAAANPNFSKGTRNPALIFMFFDMLPTVCYKPGGS